MAFILTSIRCILKRFGSGGRFACMAGALLLLGVQSQAATLGSLEHPGNFDLATYSSGINYGIDLDTASFKVRLPSGFSPDEQYGLISYIAPIDWGGAPWEWQSMMDKYRLIYVGGDNIGNGNPDSSRRGAGILGAMRMTELYPNIDTNRIYASGTSGGARMASGLYFLRDDFFKGILSNVGFETADRLPADDFDAEFDDPDHLSMYEYGTVRWVGEDAKTPGRTAQQTYYNSWGDFTKEGDYREMENLSIYHLSMIANGNDSKLINSSGDHGTKLDYAFEESIKWMLHPLIPAIEDGFADGDIASNPAVGNGFSVISNPAKVSETSVSGIATGSVDVLQLEADTEIRSSDIFDWNDDYGMRLVTALRSDFGGDYNQRMEVSLLPADVREGAALRLIIEQTDRTTKTGELVLVQGNGTPLTLCSFSFMADDEPMDRAADDRAYFLNDDFGHPASYEAPGYNFRGLNIHWFMDDDKFQINFRQTIDRSTFTSDLAVPPILTLERWTVQGRWSDMGIDPLIDEMKSIHQWRVALKNEAIAPGAANSAYVDFLKVHTAQPSSVAAMDGSESAWQYIEQQADASQLLRFEAEDFHRQEVQGVHRWVRDSSLPGYAGSGAVTTLENWGTTYTANNSSTWAARLDYPLNLTTSGSYRVWVRARAPGGLSDDTCIIGLNEDGTDAAPVEGFGSGAYTWAAATIKADAAGENWFHLWVGKDGLVVDQILLTPDFQYAPPGATFSVDGKVVNINFYRSAPNTIAGADQGPISYPGETWNSMGGGSAENLLDSEGSPTGIGLDIGKSSQWSFNAGLDVLSQYIYTQNASQSFMFSGLTAGEAYDIAFLGHGDNHSQAPEITLGGTSKVASPTNAAASTWTEGENYVAFYGITADVNGQIAGTYSNYGSNTFGSLGGVQIVVQRPIEDPTYALDLVGNNAGSASGEFADYASLSTGAAWGDSFEDDGAVELSVGRTGLNGEVSLTGWFDNYAGTGSEIVYTKASFGAYSASDASTAMAEDAFIAIQLDSSALASVKFTLSALRVAQWRDSAASATGYQLAYDADGDGYDTADLIGSPVNVSATGAGAPFEVFAEFPTTYATQHEARLYYWGQANESSDGATHLFEVEANYREEIEAAPTNYFTWAKAFSGTASIGVGTDDFDGDGIANRLEYALGQSPLTHSANLTGRFERVDGTLEWVVSLDHFASRQDVDIYLMHSADLAPDSWQPVAQSLGGNRFQVQNGASILSETGSDPVELRLLMPSDAVNKQGFFRWRVE